MKINLGLSFKRIIKPKGPRPAKTRPIARALLSPEKTLFSYNIICDTQLPNNFLDVHCFYKSNYCHKFEPNFQSRRSPPMNDSSDYNSCAQPLYLRIHKLVSRRPQSRTLILHIFVRNKIYKRKKWKKNTRWEWCYFVDKWNIDTKSNRSRWSNN